MDKKIVAIIAGQILMSHPDRFLSAGKARKLFRNLEQMNEWEKSTVLRHLRKIFGFEPYKTMSAIGQDESGKRVADTFHSL